jgi:hypothetical protein
VFGNWHRSRWIAECTAWLYRLIKLCIPRAIPVYPVTCCCTFLLCIIDGSYLNCGIVRGLPFEDDFFVAYLLFLRDLASLMV